jgi:hypothetical protein
MQSYMPGLRRFKKSQEEKFLSVCCLGPSLVRKGPIYWDLAKSQYIGPFWPKEGPHLAWLG